MVWPNKVLLMYVRTVGEIKYLIICNISHSTLKTSKRTRYIAIMEGPERTWSCWSWVIRTSYGLNWIIPLQARVLNACSSAVKPFLQGSLGTVTHQVDIHNLGGHFWVVVWPWLWCDPQLLLCEELPPWCEELHPCDSTMNSALLSHDDGNLWNHEPKLIFPSLGCSCQRGIKMTWRPDSYQPFILNLNSTLTRRQALMSIVLSKL